MKTIRLSCLLVFIVCLGAASASAQVTVPLTISGNQATGEIELPGGVAADLTVIFESTTGLDATALQASATLVDPLDSTLLARLPGLGLPGTFPVLLRVEPTETSTLSFRGTMTVSLYTYNLTLRSDQPLSMFCAHNGGDFEDVTKTETMGSYRVDGSGGSMSEFVVVLDTRNIDAVINQKFDAVGDLLQAQVGILPSGLLNTLNFRLGLARGFYLLGRIGAAISQLNQLNDAIVAQSGLVIPDTYQAHTSLVNTAGTLRASIDTHPLWPTYGARAKRGSFCVRTSACSICSLKPIDGWPSFSP